MSELPAICPRCAVLTEEGPVRNPWVCWACCAEASGSIRIEAHPMANASRAIIVQSGWPRGSGSDASAPAGPALERWAGGLESAAVLVRSVLQAIKGVPAAAQVAAGLMGKELMAHVDANTQRLVVSGLLPHVARRLVEEFDGVEGPRLEDAELLRLMRSRR